MTRRIPGSAGFLLLWILGQGQPLAMGRPVGASLGKIQDIRVTGLKQYSPAEVLPMAGLAIGQTVTEDDLKEATNVLARTGAFSNLAYSYSTMAGTVKVTVDLEETSQVLAVRLDNFVWWTDEELRRKLRARVPLYRDQLPIAGSLPDSVADGLQAFLSERQLPGHVTYARFGAEGHPLEAFVYRVEDIATRVRAVDFPGTGDGEARALQDAARQLLLGKQYSAAQVVAIASSDFRDVYESRGYLQVEFGAPSATAAELAKPEPPAAESAASDVPDGNVDSNLVRVDVHVPVQPGPQFRMASVDWAGNHAISTEALQKLITVPPGDLADVPRLRENLRTMTQLYGTRGFLRIQHNLEPHLDAAAKTASFTVRITEGEVYRFGELTIEGVDPKTAARLRDRWSLRPGEPFDSSYEMSFLKETQSLLPQGRWSAADTHLDETEKTVDVVLRYTPTSIN